LTPIMLLYLKLPLDFYHGIYAAFNRKWLGLWRRVGVESSFAGPQSRDFKR